MLPRWYMKAVWFTIFAIFVAIAIWYVASRLTDLMITVAICFFLAFAQEVDLGHDPARRLGILALGADRGEQPAAPDPDLDLAADLSGQGNRGIAVVRAFVQALKIERDGRTRPGDFQHDADRFARIVNALGGGTGPRPFIRRTSCSETAVIHAIHARYGPLPEWQGQPRAVRLRLA